MCTPPPSSSALSLAFDVPTHKALPATLAAALSPPSELLELAGLPPLHLCAYTPTGYPSRAPPDVALRCCWLDDAHLETIAARLASMWSPGLPVLCEWVDFLSECAWVELLPRGLLSPLRLPDAPPLPPPTTPARRSVRWPREAAACTALVVGAHRRAEEALWRATLHECGICLETCAAVDCHRLQCAHTFCRRCLSAYFLARVDEGQSVGIECPEPKCRAAPSPSDVCALLPPAAFATFEAALLQQGLAQMDDVVWCPRPGCGYPAICHEPTLPEEEGGKPLATCGRCSFAFCAECGRAWHGNTHCVDLHKLWRTADADGREALRRRYGDYLFAELESSEFIAANTKPCPKCAAATEKNGGCNHMTCRSCRFEWCWLCLKPYTSTHYSGYGPGVCRQFSDDFYEEIFNEEAVFNGAFFHQ